MEEKLKISKGNAKLRKPIHILSLPAGWSCPGALKCKSKVVHDGKSLKVLDGNCTEFRCYAASEEARFPATYRARQYNFNLLREASSSKALAVQEMVRLINRSLPDSDTGIMRIHASGDFFSQDYFDAWLAVAYMNPGWHFYGYTKSINYWLNRYDMVPYNMTLTASFGGRYDDLINIDMKHSIVVFSTEEAEALGYPIDHDDSLAMQKETNFAILLHGIQPKGSEAAIAMSKLNKKGWKGYGRQQNASK